MGAKGRLVIAVIVAGAALHCGGSRNEDVIGPADGGSSSSGSSGSGGSSDGSTSADGASSGAGDASGSSSGDAGDSCEPGSGSCGPGRTCLCCGSVGPREICLCTNACKNDGECPYSTHSLCNKPKSQQQGICTPRDFDCCWACQ